MAKTKAEQRELRKAQLEKLSIPELENTKPYKKDTVAPIKPEPFSPKSISKEQMIETILKGEGLGQDAVRR